MDTAAKPNSTDTHGAIALLYVLVVFFVAIFTLKAIQIHQTFGTTAYDLGIFDQATWLASRAEDLFNTVRGMHSWGDHYRPIDLIYVPFYYLIPSVNWAFLFQSLSVGLGAIALFYIGRILLPDNPAAALVLSAAFLANPAVHNTLLWQYHSMVMATGPYLFLILFYLKNRLTPFIVTLLILLCCREDMPATLAAFGLVAMWQRKWRFAFSTLLICAAWWLTVTRVIMPHFNGVGYFRDDSGALNSLINRLLDVDFYRRRFITDTDARQYAWLIFSPVLFLPLLAPAFLFPALPALLFNMMTGAYNTRIFYHYSVNIVPFLFVATLAAMAAINRKFNSRLPATILVGTVLAATAVTAVHHSALHPDRAAADFRYWRQQAPLREMIAEYTNSIPPDYGISASDYLLPHLSHRKSIYLFPNPWVTFNWGINGENPAHPNDIQYIFVKPERYHLYQNVLSYLLNSGYFERIRRTGGLIAYRRIADEPLSREEAIAQFKHYIPPPALTFTAISVSGPYPLTTDGPDSPQINPAVPIDERDPQWKMLPDAPTSFLNIDFCALLGCVPNSLAYVYAEVIAEQPHEVILSTGSDDGLTAWFNGETLIEKHVHRAAIAGDEIMTIALRPGKNIFYFRVDNSTGAWRLFSELKKR